MPLSDRGSDHLLVQVLQQRLHPITELVECRLRRLQPIDQPLDRDVLFEILEPLNGLRPPLRVLVDQQLEQQIRAVRPTAAATVGALQSIQSSVPRQSIERSDARGGQDRAGGPERAIRETLDSRAARQKTTEHVCPEPRRSVTIRTASMHLRTGAWGKKSIAKLPNLSKCVEATLLTLPPRKGETPRRRREDRGNLYFGTSRCAGTQITLVPCHSLIFGSSD